MPKNQAKSQRTDEVRMLSIGPEQAGQRIDNFLVRHLKKVPKSHIYRILRTGQVRVNSKRVRPEYRLQTDDLVRLPPVRITESSTGGAPTNRVLAQVQEAVLYEDNGLLILNKPAGLAVHGGSGLSYGAIEALRALRPQAPFLELVHRLDRDTSGCLMVAKKRSVLRALHEALRNGAVDKRYLALLAGPWQGGDRRVSAPLHKNLLRGGERVVRVSDSGKSALTVFRPLTRFADATLVEAELGTGRTHQIRVHAAHIGHPIAGDEKYGDETFNRTMRERGLRRLFLHAHTLSFQLPGAERELTVSAPLPQELREVLNHLEAQT